MKYNTLRYIMKYNTKGVINMPRTGISYEDVAQAARAIVEAGGQPTIQKIREKLGTGSPNTVLQHLNKWRGSHEVAPTVTMPLDPASTDFFTKQLESRIATLRGEKNEEIERLKSDMAEMVDGFNGLEDHNGELEKKISSMAAEAEQWKGERQALEQQLAELKKELAQERAGRLEAEKLTAECKAVEAFEASVEKMISTAMKECREQPSLPTPEAPAPESAESKTTPTKPKTAAKAGSKRPTKKAANK
jgi:DNA repair exonuclease SbcCD ATPase subunit